MTQELLQAHDLRVGYKVFDGILQVLDGVDFILRDSEKIGLVGETGCGKTDMIFHPSLISNPGYPF